MTPIELLDFYTKIALDSIWKEQVQECIKNDIETGKTYYNLKELQTVTETQLNTSIQSIVINH
jgi:hypothetical protein